MSANDNNEGNFTGDNYERTERRSGRSNDDAFPQSREIPDTGRSENGELRVSGGGRQSAAESRHADGTSRDGELAQNTTPDDSGTSGELGDSEMYSEQMGANTGQHLRGTGDTGNRLGLAEIRQIREQCRNILASHPDNTNFTPEELATLAQYEGAGGLGEENATAEGTLSEFYTDNKIIAKTWELLDAYAPDATAVLEPAAGTGRWAVARNKNSFTLQEIDPTSARIAQILHPEATVRIGAYQQNFFDDTGRVHHTTNPDQEKYDLCVGNFPYGQYNSVFKGRGEGEEFNREEEYFVHRGLDAIKPYGIEVSVLPSGFLRTNPDRAKEIIAEKGELIDAWRLPNKSFATTEVGTDIVFIRKAPSPRALAQKIVQENETNPFTGEIITGATVEEKINNVAEAILKDRVSRFSNDRWFNEHPEKICGIQHTRMGQFGEEMVVDFNPGDTLDDVLNRITPEQTLSQTVVTQSTTVTPTIKQTHKIRRKSNKNNQESAITRSNEPVETLTAEEFAAKYGKEFSPELMEIWQKANYKGEIAIDDLMPETRNYLASRDDFIEFSPGKFQHKVLFASGNIYTKLDEFEKQQQGEFGVLPPEKAEIVHKTLLAAIPEFRPAENITFHADTVLAEELTFKYHNAKEDFDEELPLKELFIRWATNCDAPESHGNSRWWIRDYSATPLSPEDIPDACSWMDILEFMEGKSVRAEMSSDPAKQAANAMAAAKKRDARRDTANKLFSRFLLEGLTPDQKTVLAKEWNRRFNAIRQADYSQLPFYIDGMAKTYKGLPLTLNQQQQKGVPFLSKAGNGLLAYDVGVGKTMTGIVSAVHSIQTGRAKHPLIMVPKSVYSKWVDDVHAIFPNVKVNELGNFGDKFINDFRDPDNPHSLKLENGSISVCTYEALQKMSVKDETINSYLTQDYADILGSASTKNDKEEWDNASKRTQQADFKKIQDAVGTGSKAKEGFIFIEGVFDALVADEAHRVKNLVTQPRAKNPKGANEYAALGQGNPSARALKFFALTSVIQHDNQGRNVTLLTATPFTNSPLEVYSMLKYVGQEQLRAMHINNLTDFIAEFAQLKSEWAVTPDGNIKLKQVMKEFTNLGALQGSLLIPFIDKVDGEEAGVIRPRKVTHKVLLDPNEIQNQIIAAESERMNDPEAAQNGGILVAMNNMRLAMVSPALVSGYEFPTPPLEEVVTSSPKLKLVCDSVVDGWKNNNHNGQIIYMPRGISSYPYVKQYLVSKGIPADAIDFIEGSLSGDKKDALVEKFNNKEHPLKIIIGSDTIAEGVDLNKNTTTIYNTMIGWNPSESVQVEGRAWRQGNEQGKVHIVYPFMRNSIEALLSQKHDEKSSRVSSIFSYKGDSLNVADINPEELKFELIRDPEKRANFIIEQRIADFRGNITTLAKKIESLDDVKKKFTETHSNLEYCKEELAKQRNELKEQENEFTKLYPDEESQKAPGAFRMKGTIQWYKQRVTEYERNISRYNGNLTTLNHKLERLGIDYNDWEKSIPAAIADMQSKLNDLGEQAKKVKEEKASIIIAET